MANSDIPTEIQLARQVDELVDELGALLLANGWSMATAESCTGGWIAKCCTDRAGSSGWFDCGVVSYSNRAKQDLLGVDGATLAQFGAVSREVAIEMVTGIRHRSGVAAAVAVTGVAGPNGGSAEKPIGTVWFGWSIRDRAPDTERIVFSGDRETIRLQTVAHALRGLVARLGS